MSRTAAVTAGAVAGFILLFHSQLRADEPVRLKESFSPGQQFRIQSRMKGTAKLTVPSEKDKDKTESLTKTAESDIDYLERVLEADGAGAPNRMLRVYEKIDFRKEVDRQKLTNTVREPVRRMVVVREKALKVPFSPDGPLLYGEIELVRADVFTPTLAGLLPAEEVKPGDSWKASEAAVRELTDMQRESGELTCKFVELTMLAGRKVAQISVTGSVSGVGEDGPVRHEFDGRIFFDLQSNHLCYLSLLGKQSFLDKDGKTTGTIEGTLTMTRQARLASAKLSDDVVRDLTLTPDKNNTLLLYDNEDLGVRFTYPRRWRVSGVQNRQVMIDADNGNGILLTPLPAKEVPAPEQYAKETQDFVRQQQGKLLGSTPGRRLQSNPDVDYFGYEVELKGERLVLDYYVARMREYGATLAARLVPADAKELRPEVERIARSVVVTK